jgi:hypothetical protein
LDAEEVFSIDRDGLTLRAIDFTSQEHVRLRLYIAHQAGLDRPDLMVLNALDERGWSEFVASMRAAFADMFVEEGSGEADEESFRQTQGMLRSTRWVMAYVAPRGIGPTAWDPSERKQIQHRRRFYLLGQTLDGMRVLDIRRAVHTLRSTSGMQGVSLWLQAHGRMAGVTLYASLFEPDITRLDLHQLPTSHRDGPFLLNVRRFMDLPQAVSMAAEKSRVVIYQQGEDGWEYPRSVAERLGWANTIELRKTAIDD